MAKLNFSIALGLAADKFKNGLTQAQNQVKGFVNNVRSIVSGMTGIMGTIGFVEFSRQMIQAGRNFQQSMSQVQAVSGATKEQLKTMSDEAKRLGSTTKYSASEAANALENLTRNGMSAEDATVALSKTLSLAAAGGLDLAQSADIATNTMNAFKMQANEVGKVADVFAYAAAHSATNVEMLGTAMTNVAPIAKNNNISLEETTACLGALANVGIKGANAGTQLRMVMLGLSKPTANQAKAFKELGVSITEQDIKTQGLTANLQKLLDAGIMQRSNSNTLLAQIFGSKTVAASAALLTNLQSATSMMGELETKAVGTASAMAKMQSDTLDGDIKALQSAWESFNIALFETKDGALRSLVQGLTDFVTFAKENLSSLAQLVVSAFAAIKLTPIIQSWLASVKAGEAQAAASARAAATKRAAIEENLTRQKNALAVLEVRQTEVTGSQKVRIDQQVAAKRQAIKKLETQLVEAQNAEQTANTAATAASQATIWSSTWAGIKAAGVMCWTTIKAAMVSTGIGAIIMGITLAVQKLWDYFDMGEKVSKCWDYVCDGCKRAWDWGNNLVTKFGQWYDSLGMIGKAVLAMIAPFTAVYGIIRGIVGQIAQGNAEGGKGGKGQTAHKYKGKNGKVYQTESEARASYGGKTGKSNIIQGSNSLYSSNQDLLDALKTKGGKGTSKKSVKEEASEDVADAEKKYANTIRKLQGELEVHGISVEDAHKDQLQALKSLYEAYSEAYAVTGDGGYLTKMRELVPQIENLSSLTEAESEAIKAGIEAEKEKTAAMEKAAEAQKTMNKELADLANQSSGGRDTTFDYKFTGKKEANLKLQADLEFNLENAQKRLDILKKAAEDGCTEAINQIADAEKNVTSLEEQLKLAKVKSDVEDLQKELSNLTLSSVQQSWQAIESTVSSISGMIDTLSDPDASAWEKFASIINTVMSLMQTFIGIYETFNAIQEISTALGKAKTEQTTEEVAENSANAGALTAMASAESVLAGTTPAATTALAAQSATLKPLIGDNAAMATELGTMAAAETVLAIATPIATTAMAAQAAGAAASVTAMTPMTAAAGELAAALEIEAAAAIFAAHASIPFVGPAIAAGFVGMMEGILAGVKVAAHASSFSTGGKVKGNSPVGDFVPCWLNSGETVINTTQESNLLKIANGGGVGGGRMRVSGVLTGRGRNLVAVIGNESNIAAASGRRGVKL